MARMSAAALAILASLVLVVPRAGVGAAPPGTLHSPATAAHGFANARLPWRFSFPRDHAAHVAFQSEWWYYTGHLRASDGRRFGYELTFFRYGLRPEDVRPRHGESAWRGSQVFPAHLAITDVDGKRFAYDERFAREALGMGSASARALNVRAGDWWLRGTSPFRMHAASAAVGTLDVVQVAEKKPVVNGRDGVSLKGACATCASHYYSMTRLRTSGTLVYRGARLRVDGISWMDHEFGSDELARGVVGWDWFSVQLDDAREIMDYRLRRADGGVVPESGATLVARDGGTRFVDAAGVLVDATGAWTSPRTHGVYPSGWRMRVPSAGLDLTLTPVLRDQELADTAGGVSYWEGAVEVTDTVSGRRRGAGYVELTGYAGDLAL